MNQILLTLKQFFGYETFRPGQEKIISSILLKKDVLAIMPTSAGKSICYQIPAIIFPGITIVISPLIALMKDQVDNLNKKGIPSTYLNSSLSTAEFNSILTQIKSNIFKIIYIAPERLYSKQFLSILNSLNISLFAIDEAHCVSQWGHDFRPSYQIISPIISKFKIRPTIAAFTATATSIVKNDIIELLNLKNPFILTSSFNRSNLKFIVEKIENTQNKLNYILNYLNSHNLENGIIYCSTRKNVEFLYSYLSNYGYKLSKYHGGMNELDRTFNQNNFIKGFTKIMIATNAFGMGIDKPDIRYILHYNLPKDLESYYQEAGRAGRDQNSSECILLFSSKDININKYLISKTSNQTIRKVQYNKLNSMIGYSATTNCLRNFILNYFGEASSFQSCNNCSNCLTSYSFTDITIESNHIFSCIIETKEHFDLNIICDILLGASSPKLKKLNCYKLATYGILKDYSKKTILSIIYFLISKKYIIIDFHHYNSLKLTDSGLNILDSNKSVIINKSIEKNLVSEPYSFFKDLCPDATILDILIYIIKKFFEML